MRKRRPTLAVEFLCTPDHAGAPKPIPARSSLPKWYKDIPVSTDLKFFNASGGPKMPSLKKCLPFLDAMSAGYIIPLWFDLAISVMDDGHPKFNYRPDKDRGFELDNQLGSEVLPNNVEIHKFLSPWVVRTPPGISCLFIAPMNQGDLPFKILSGIVETDTYRTPVNLPFEWTGWGFAGNILSGTPLVQVIPFNRRDSFNLVVGVMDDKDIVEMAESKYQTNTVFTDGYRNNNWEKKEWDVNV